MLVPLVAVVGGDFEVFVLLFSGGVSTLYDFKSKCPEFLLVDAECNGLLKELVCFVLPVDIFVGSLLWRAFLYK